MVEATQVTERFDYVIVGGGPAADSAARAIREHDADGSIALVTEDAWGPYDRTALSKGAWIDRVTSESAIDSGTVAATGATLHIDTMVTGIDRSTRALTTNAGRIIGYEKLLLATGARPRIPEGITPGARILVYRGFADFQAVRELVREDARIGLVGGGFIATELAASLRRVGARVVLITPDTNLYELRFPGDLSEKITERYRDEGVELRLGERIVDAGQTGFGGVRLAFADGGTFSVDALVIAIGAIPNTALASDAGIALDPERDGILVDNRMRTSDPAIWAAGDVASYPDPLFGRSRVEHIDQAQHSGAAAGADMAGAGTPYNYTPFFWSDLFDWGYEAIGDIDATHRIAARWQKPLEEGQLFYVDESSVPVGVLTWNSYGRMDAARALLEARQPIDPENPPELAEN